MYTKNREADSIKWYYFYSFDTHVQDNLQPESIEDFKNA